MRSLTFPLAVFFLAISFARIAVAGPGSFEQLRFRLGWWVVPGGTALMQFQSESGPMGPGQKTEFRTQACTNPALDLFHKVRDSILVEAVRAESAYRTRRYWEKIREGRYENHMELLFEPGGTARLVNYGRNIRERIPLRPGTNDLITAFYNFRNSEITVGDQYEVPVIDNHRAYDLRIDVLAKERRGTLLGKATPTIIVRPQLLSDGIFRRKGELRIWLTDDQRHLPVHMESKIAIGKIYADLVEVSNDASLRVNDTLFCE